MDRIIYLIFSFFLLQLFAEGSADFTEDEIKQVLTRLASVETELEQTRMSVSNLGAAMTGLKEENQRLRGQVDGLQAQARRVDVPVYFTMTLEGDVEMSPGEAPPYNVELVNMGLGYDANLQRFSAPEDGTYVFYVEVRAASGSCVLDLQENGATRLQTNGEPGSQMYITQLERGEVVTVVTQTTCMLDGRDSRYNTFSGFRIV